MGYWRVSHKGALVSSTQLHPGLCPMTHLACIIVVRLHLYYFQPPVKQNHPLSRADISSNIRGGNYGKKEQQYTATTHTHARTHTGTHTMAPEEGPPEEGGEDGMCPLV